MKIEDITQGIPLEVLERRMRPSEDSSWGMLGREESLVEVINSDEETLRGVGVSHERIAEEIERLMGLGGVSLFGDHYLCIDHISCGTKDCPWDDGHDDKESYLILLDTQNKEHHGFLEYWKHHRLPYRDEFTRLFTGEPSIVVSGMMPHLIRDHHFFEGRETTYRCDPEQLSKYLGLLK